MPRDPDVTVMHLVEASGGGEVMYGKERVIHWLMRAQRDAGDVDARLAVLARSDRTRRRLPRRRLER